MTREQIKNFNYRAFIKLVQDNPEWAKRIKEKGYDVYHMLNDVFASYELNGKFKQELLSLYREEFEEKENKDAKLQFEKFCEAYPMQKGRDFQQELHNIELDIAEEVETQLKRIGKVFKRQDEGLEFLGYSTTEDINEIHPDGELIFRGIDESVSFKSALDAGDIQLYDAASLLEELRKM